MQWYHSGPVQPHRGPSLDARPAARLSSTPLVAISPTRCAVALPAERESRPIPRGIQGDSASLPLGRPGQARPRPRPRRPREARREAATRGQGEARGERNWGPVESQAPGNFARDSLGPVRRTYTKLLPPPSPIVVLQVWSFLVGNLGFLLTSRSWRARLERVEGERPLRANLEQPEPCGASGESGSPSLRNGQGALVAGAAGEE